MNIKTKLYHDNFQNFKRYGIPRAQLVIADVPYNLGANAYASSTEWYNGSGTTAEVAQDLGRNCIGIDLNESSLAFCRDRGVI